MKIESTGNTLDQAKDTLRVRRELIICKSKKDVHFRSMKVYGNFELGYKVVQEYSVIK